MKKIKNIQQVQAEKRRLKQRQQELEQEIQLHWHELKESLKPVNLAADALGSLVKNRVGAAGSGLLKNTLTYGVTLLAGNLLRKAGIKTEQFFSRRQ